MTNFLKEIGKRVSLYDIIEEAKETDAILNSIDNEPEKQVLGFQYLTRHACRVMFRVAGNLEVALAGYFGYTAESVDPEQIKMCVLLGAGGVLTYLADYALFDKMTPLPSKKKD
ncbi:MAG TPA: hypothetical protein VJB13_00110 [Candidatus Nanoarchaeia archaeon]|nr:hypothetical protein [Candidatus Nanoarchaeia archaeon]